MLVRGLVDLRCTDTNVDAYSETKCESMYVEPKCAVVFVPSQRIAYTQKMPYSEA